jgi:hypothetical protein
MRKLGTAIVIFALAAVPALVQAQPGCRSECERVFRQCQQDCAGADDRNQCLSDCQTLHQQCLANCQ